jgi:hypothetical protein
MVLILTTIGDAMMKMGKGGVAHVVSTSTESKATNLKGH